MTYIPQSPMYQALGSRVLANSSAETSAFGASSVGTLTLPPNYLTAGRIIRLTAGGVFSTTILIPTLTIRVKMGTTVLASTVASSLLSAANNNGFQFVVKVDCRAVSGSTATLAIDGHLNYATTLTTRAFADLNNAGATVSVDPTLSQILDVTLQWSAASASNSITVVTSLVEAFGGS